MSARASPPDRRLATAEWQALGTTVLVRVTRAAGLWAARAAVEEDLAAIDAACSRFRADSEVSLLNARSGRATKLSPLLCEALALALRAAELTDGDVDPTVGHALELSGYDRDFKLLRAAREGEPPPRVTITARVRTGWQTVALDRQNATAIVPAGVKLDLGATAKAWAADRAAAAAAAAAGCGALVSVGGDIATCGAPPKGGWKIHVTDDHRSSATAPGQTVAIEAGGLATSSTAVRRWSHKGNTMHHILDPRTGAPATDTWRTVSVAAASCADANIATTAAIVRGAGAPAWLDRCGLPARLLGWDGSMLTVGDWPAETALAA
jgi:thiamine biosynthesis lipoprotein ApbE